MAKIVFLSDLNIYSKGFMRAEALHRLGHDLLMISHAPVLDAESGTVPRSFLFRAAWKLGFHLDTENVNRSALETVVSNRPSVIWIDKGNMIRPATLETIRAAVPGVIIVSYSDDDMTARHNATRRYRKSLPHYDLVVTTKSFNADPAELPALGARRVIVVDKYYDPETHKPVSLDDEERERYGSEVGFIGSFAEDRFRLMLSLADKGIPVRIWGNGWDRHTGAHPNLRIENRALVNLPGDLRYTLGVRATDINLGFLRKENRDLHTDRSVEIPACGGFMLAERSVEHERLFEEGREAAYFDDADDLFEKVQFYRDNPELRRAIAAAGRGRCIRDGYDIDSRMSWIMSHLET